MSDMCKPLTRPVQYPLHVSCLTLLSSLMRPRACACCSKNYKKK